MKARLAAFWRLAHDGPRAWYTLAGAAFGGAFGVLSVGGSEARAAAVFVLGCACLYQAVFGEVAP